MSIKSSINKVSSIRVLFFYNYKIECWPVFKQDPLLVQCGKWRRRPVYPVLVHKVTLTKSCVHSSGLGVYTLGSRRYGTELVYIIPIELL